MKEFESIRKDIQNKRFQPIYFFWGDEPYFIDVLTQEIIKNALSEEEKAFNEHIFYGNEISIEDVVMQAKQFPVMAERQLIVIKEAQHLSRTMANFATYAEDPVPTSIVVFNFKNKKPDGRSAFLKNIKKTGVVAESKKMYENQLPTFIETQAQSLGLKLHPKVKFLLTEFIGNDLSRIQNELAKIASVIKNGEEVSPEFIEKNIGISKDYNNFELVSAIAEKNQLKAFSIAKYFGKNPKDNPIIVTNSALFNFFSNLLLFHSLLDKSRGNVAANLKINPFFVKEYELAAQNYPVKKVTRIISFLRESDAKSKGIGSSNSTTGEDILIEFLYKTFKI
ncbi:DNA polymerase III subunit delta [Ornithobacterium rhinotracheale]|uniref:DNA polymerase III subunit delta n=1 Tax=Ornithobacterium rhinotracheale TaxID=28251 RepID=UPI001FF41C55|nr:DNA polymerase III subunit delta [Ornithobacterium rhinotracheale]MCK0204408.1 DNA polymerase III subunit delta [Ornithobacterium rhinotracheale]